MTNKNLTDEQIAELLSQVPPVPDGSSFSLVKVEKVHIPHPYCIGPGHVRYAADRYHGTLSAESIRSAECAGIICEICKEQGKKLPYDKHETSISLFVAVPQNRDLNAVSGLAPYLHGIKDKCTELGIDGFAFPLKTG